MACLDMRRVLANSIKIKLLAFTVVCHNTFLSKAQTIRDRIIRPPYEQKGDDDQAFHKPYAFATGYRRLRRRDSLPDDGVLLIASICCWVHDGLASLG